VFLLARYWRRSEAVTEIDFIRLRYGEGPASSTLRVFKALFDGILVNCIIMASVTLAMAKILTTVLGLSGMKIVALPILGEVTASGMILSCLTVLVVLYCAMSGLYGVVYTDVLQFIVAMIGSVLLAVIMYFDASSGEGMLAKLQASPHFTDA
jgi:SSS family solute:Na+ symporter